MFSIKNKGFSLSEVLITLSIIGVVASLTLPPLIQNYHNHSVETKLKKIYTTVNQAFTMSEIDNGDFKNWCYNLNTQSGINKYLLPYIKYIKVTVDSGKTDFDYIWIYFADGTVLAKNKRYYQAWKFYTMLPEKCEKFLHPIGVCRFDFYTTPEYHFDGFYCNSNPTLYVIKNDQSYGCLTSGHYCSLWIQQNGWRIPKDYPYKVR